ncbi:hypothetical protein HMPREF0322_03038 [Desulfitobacterium hafniense DP7]|uniref:DUF4194 domain-containing protein n=1 Tax=Desulfitobacterium hafniense DP7 TaxID=537010 RepID=G9XPZ2_DESHA|nr:hypothetical protein [Desulfitobacterium hafniense]EHL06286.1 hypothetical protein HMPREF0322_03038 [Desulfitobacterium hafniense DP7]
MEHQEIKINPEAQRICSLFHYGWVNKKDVPNLESDTTLFRDVQFYFSLMGYELLNPVGTEFYVIRLKKEFDTNAFDFFQKRNKALDRRHLALLTIIYAKLIMPKKLGHMEEDAEIYLTKDQIVLSYGDKFRNAKQNPKAAIEQLLRPLKKYYYISVEKDKILPGPAMYMLHNDLLTDLCEFVIQGITDNLKEIPKVEEAELIEGDEFND